MLIKSSMETLELAYDAVNMVYKNLLNQPGQMYNKWFIKNGYGQDNAYIMAEHTDYSVRLFFTFTDTGFVYVEGYFTNGSSYDRKNITSWKFDNDEYPFEETTDHVKQVLDNFFDEGINVLRGEEVYNSKKNIQSAKKPVKSANEEETVYEVYYPYGAGIKEPWTTTDRDVAMRMKKDGLKVKVRKQVKSSRRTIKSGRRQEVSNKDFINKLKSMKSKGWSTSVVGYYENDLDTDEQRLYVSGGEYTFTNNDDERRKLSRQIMALNGGEGIGYKKRNFEDVINSSLKSVKSSADNLPSEVYYMMVNGAKMYYSTDYDKVADMVQKTNSKPGPRVYGPYTEDDPEEIQELYEVGYLSNSRRAIKSSAQSDYDKGADYAEEQYQKYVEGGIDAEDIAAPADCSNDFFNGFNDKILEYKISSSRKSVKSSVAPDGLTFDSRYDDDDYSYLQYKVNNNNILNIVKEYLSYDEDELQPGNVYINLMYDESDTLVAGQVVDTENSTWDLSPEECVEIFGSDIMTYLDPGVGNHAVDEFMDFDVDPETVKSSFVVGKTMDDGSKLYYCEDNCFYDENNYSRPDIKVFDNEVDAKKIAKRSKNGFAMPLEVR